MKRAALAAVVAAAALAACGPEATVIDAPAAIDARADAAAVVDAAIDAPPAIDALDAPLPCQTPVLSFTMDGVLDAGAPVIAGGVTSIRIAAEFSADGRLYVATDDAGEGSDHFLLLTAGPPGLANIAAPFAKAGAISTGNQPMLFLADENDNDFEGWFRKEVAGADTMLAGAAYAAATGANGGVLEGTVDLVAVYGAVPATVYLAAVPYATADGGALVTAAQTPAGNGDGNVDAAEYVAFPIPCNAP